MSDWNFSRPELAEHYISILETGLFSNLAIIAPRRKGKTLFMLQDLAPLAKEHNYFPIYANLWQNINSPQEGLISAFQEALGVMSKQSTLGRLLNSKVRKTALSNELLGKMEIEFADSPSKVTNNELALLEQLMVELESKAGKKKILLLVDEVQHLATSTTFDPLTYSLRTLIDKRQGRIKSIFTGSSRHYMDLLFNQSQAAFYHFVERVPFPDLDDEFCQFISSKLEVEYDITVATNKLSDAFERLGYSPYWMIKLVGHLVTFGRDFKTSFEYIIQLVQETEGFESIANRLKPIDKMVYIAITDRVNIFTKDFLAAIEEKTGLKGIPANVQRSVSRLSEQQLISLVSKGEYHIEKAGLRHFLERKT